MAPPPLLPLGARKSLLGAGSSAVRSPQSRPPPRRVGPSSFPACAGGCRLGSPRAPERSPGSAAPPDAGAGGSGRGRARRAPGRARGPCGAMNGTANPLLDREEHCLRLGESFEKRPRASFHTIRCESAPRPPSALQKARGPCRRSLPRGTSGFSFGFFPAASSHTRPFPQLPGFLRLALPNASSEGHWTLLRPEPPRPLVTTERLRPHISFQLLCIPASPHPHRPTHNPIPALQELFSFPRGWHPPPFPLITEGLRPRISFQLLCIPACPPPPRYTPRSPLGISPLQELFSFSLGLASTPSCSIPFLSSFLFFPCPLWFWPPRRPAAAPESAALHLIRLLFLHISVPASLVL